MCRHASGIERGREVYNLLWSLRQSGKKVYLLRQPLALRHG